MASVSTPLISVAEFNVLRQGAEPGLLFEVAWIGGGQGGEQAQAEKSAYEQDHIPGAGLLDVQQHLSIPKDKATGGDVGLSFVRESDAARLAASLGSLGIPNTQAKIVLYSRETPGPQGTLGGAYTRKTTGCMGSTRAWWALCSWGFTNVRVLDGGYEAWKTESPNAVPSAAAAALSPVKFDASTLVDDVAHMKATQADVLAATKAGSGVQIMDTLAGWPNTAANTGKKYGPGRQGHIANAFNVPCAGLLKGDSGKFIEKDNIRTYFEAQGTDLKKPLIAY